MRILSFVFLFIFAVNISAQSTKVDDLFTQGTKHVNAGRFDEALTTYTAALATAENKYAGKEYLARLHYNIGVCYFHLDRFEAAANEFKSAILLKADYVRAHDALGKTAEFQKAVKPDPQTARID
jgi:tetratricopeptide (TPR) repeat protein